MCHFKGVGVAWVTRLARAVAQPSRSSRRSRQTWKRRNALQLPQGARGVEQMVADLSHSYRFERMMDSAWLLSSTWTTG